MREEKKKSSEISKTEVRKVTAEEFKGLQMLEKKKLDEKKAVMKVEKTQPKIKEASKKEETVEVEGKEAAAMRFDTHLLLFIKCMTSLHSREGLPGEKHCCCRV